MEGCHTICRCVPRAPFSSLTRLRFCRHWPGSKRIGLGDELGEVKAKEVCYLAVQLEANEKGEMAQ